MKLSHKAPHIRTRDSNRTLMGDAIIAMIPLYTMAVYFYGNRAVYLMAISVGVCYLCEWVAVMLSGNVINIRDISPMVTGMLIPLLLPASISYNLVIVAGVFAMWVVKHPFGGTGYNIFNPAVGGVAFVCIAWPAQAFAYPLPFTILPATSTVETALSASPLHTMNLGGIPSVDILDVILGNAAGPMGASHIVVLGSCMLFLLMRRSISASLVFSYFLGFALTAMLFPRIEVSPLQSVLYELSTGYAMIAAVFLLSDPVTSPKRKLGKMIYGFTAGILFMCFRMIGRLGDSILFVILMMNAMVWMIDYGCEVIAHVNRRKAHEN